MSWGNITSPLDLNEPVNPNDPFALGWRDVKKIEADGSESMIKTPLTLEDILHPQEEDFRVLSDPHTEDIYYLRGAFRIALSATPNAIVLNDCRIAWDREGEFGHGPDCAVIFNVRRVERWSTINVILEGTRPALIVEVTSPSTRSTDLVNKVREYAEQRVPHYVIADARETEDSRRVSLIDYHLHPDEPGYFSLPPNEDGRVWLPEVNLWLGSEDGKLVCYNPNGERLKTIVEEHEARVKAEKQAEKERRAKSEAERRAAEERKALEARIKELEEQVRRGEIKKGRN